MGNTIKKGSVWLHENLQHVVKVANTVYSFGNDLFDYISYNVCPEKPTIALAFHCMDIPPLDREAFEAILNYVDAIFGLLLHPLKIINDKKFCTHVFQTSFVFSSTGGAMAQQNKLSFCEKMLIYIGMHSNKIIEPRNKRLLDNVEIDNENYDLPVNLWYTLDMKNGMKLYFFIHISISRGYKGILFATQMNNDGLFDKIKNSASKYYTKTLGKNNVVIQNNGGQTPGQVQIIDDIL